MHVCCGPKRFGGGERGFRFAGRGLGIPNSRQRSQKQTVMNQVHRHIARLTLLASSFPGANTHTHTHTQPDRMPQQQIAMPPKREMTRASHAHPLTRVSATPLLKVPESGTASQGLASVHSLALLRAAFSCAPSRAVQNWGARARGPNDVVCHEPHFRRVRNDPQ
jgi:hypothetical protein